MFLIDFFRVWIKDSIQEFLIAANLTNIFMFYIWKYSKYVPESQQCIFLLENKTFILIYHSSSFVRFVEVKIGNLCHFFIN